MRIEENAGGGDTVVLEQGDDLARIPKSHRDLVSPSIRQAFVDPVRYFRDVANRSPFEALSAWINTVIADSQWELELNRGSPDDGRADWTMTGFCWTSDSACGALVGIPDHPDLSHFPNTLAEYYSLVDVVHWSIFGGAGGLDGAGDHDSIREFAHLFEKPADCPNDVFVIGSSGCGDMLIYSNDDRGGWLCHENGHIHWLGSTTDLINWVFGELLKNRKPEYDHEAWAVRGV